MAAGADVNRADKYGNPPIDVAVSNGHADVVKLLLAAGAKPIQFDLYSAKGESKTLIQEAMN
ncbi:MAG: ankyrin repeat domain-containing protein, partial [Leptospirillum sp.]